MSANPILTSLIPAAPPAGRTGVAPSSSQGGDSAAFEGLLNGYSESEAPPPVADTSPTAAQSALPSTLYALALRSAGTDGAPDLRPQAVLPASTSAPPAAPAPKAPAAAATAHPAPSSAPRPLPTPPALTAPDEAKTGPATSPKTPVTAPNAPSKAASKPSPAELPPSDPGAANLASTSTAPADQGFPQLSTAADVSPSLGASTNPAAPTAPAPRPSKENAVSSTPAANPSFAARAPATPADAADAATGALATQTALPPNAASVSDSDSTALASAVLSIAQAISPFDALGGAGAAAAATTPAAGNTASPLPLRGVQARTHLTVVGSRLFSVASPRAQEALEAAPAPLPSSTPTVPAAPAASFPKAGSGSTSSGGAARDDAPAATTSATPFFVDAAAGLAAAPTSTATADSVAVADLGDRLADEAATLTPAAHDPAAAALRGPVKELSFQLEPADLGKVAVKLRLTTGRLTVDIGVDNPGALSELEKQRDAMAAKLSSSAQPLESLVIHQQSAPENLDGAQTAASAGFFDAPASGEGAARRQADEPPDRSARPPAPTNTPNAPLAQRADLLV